MFPLLAPPILVVEAKLREFRTNMPWAELLVLFCKFYYYHPRLVPGYAVCLGGEDGLEPGTGCLKQKAKVGLWQKPIQQCAATVTFL